MLPATRLMTGRIPLRRFIAGRMTIRSQSTSSYQPPNAQKPNPHARHPEALRLRSMLTSIQRDFYKNNGRPIFKSFLIAVATYEVIYWSWLKLESLETVQETNGS
ncbi:hypothetical protein B0A48_05859 [Cryoendolithus antarcticus]|uniref:Uncharacterized protein n=1 Tax=Cryoendolithus antarcticus TaxID=1507870 RepID=A0A1V8TC51_9PEZI|nr:hypothetical protein B0A48_05859 [Cryoendolithus antarcticus]